MKQKMVRVSNRTREGCNRVGDLFLSVDHSRKECLQRISEILYPLLLEPRELRLDNSGGLVELLLSF
jgi:hypothetical protein